MSSKRTVTDRSDAGGLRIGYRRRYPDGEIVPGGEGGGSRWPALAATLRALRARLHVRRPGKPGRVRECP